MAKYDVTYSCGHSGVVSLVGPTRDRQRKLVWYAAAGLCPECYRATKEEERQRLAAAAAAEAQEIGLRPLNGSEKQIAWAETIRQGRMSTAYDQLMGVGQHYPQFVGQIEGCLLWLRDQVSAEWWIDHHHEDTLGLLVSCPHFADLVRDLPPEVAGVYRQRVEAALEVAAEEEKRAAIAAKRNGIRSAVMQVFGKSVRVRVGRWVDKRVYIGDFHHGIEYYHEGNKSHQEGELVHKAMMDSEWWQTHQADVRKLCEQLANDWTELTLV